MAHLFSCDGAGKAVAFFTSFFGCREVKPVADFSGELHTLVIPSRVAARVTSQPRLPPFKVQWYWTDHGPEYQLESVEFEAQILYEEHGRHDRSRIVKLRGASLLGEFDFSGDVLGGVFECKCLVNWRRSTDGVTGSTPQSKEQWAILGDNPTKSEVRSILPELPLQVIAYKESRFRQFDNLGLPLFGPPRGFGVMQLDNPPATGRQLWDWRQNIAGGITLYRTKIREVNQHFENEYRAHANAPHLNAEQLRLSLYQYYNGGWYWAWDSHEGLWRPSGNVAYGDDSLRVEKMVASGRRPPGWD